MKSVRQFVVNPKLPKVLEPLRELALNLRWAWDHDAISLFRHLDAELWETSYHNPIVMLGRISQERLETSAKDDAFLAHLEFVFRQFRERLEMPSWFEKNHTAAHYKTACIAYFSMEFGITECLPIYSGGLGILAGDHLKSASYLGLPFVGVGLMYQHGYFEQWLNSDGWQIESYPENDFYNMPVQLEQRADGSPVMISLNYPEGVVHARIWRAQIGRVPLYLLDTNIPENTNPDARNITDHLYGGDSWTRIRQEILLGIGGYRALVELGLRPTVCHMNEGHSAFLAIERIRQLMVEKGIRFDEAREVTVAGNVFTTHTPVPAGIDIFPTDLVDRYLGAYYHALGIPREEFLRLGQENAADPNSGFSMAVLALRLSSYCNGVSQIHGWVSRTMWRHLWPGLPEGEIPISSITNGIHIRSWVSGDIQGLFNRYLGPQWVEMLTGQSVWTQIDRIPETELWRTHERRRERLVAFARTRLRQQLIRVGASPAEIRNTDDILDPEALTIGFARRFATYKRAALLFEDANRLAKILNHPDRPVQIIYAGKAHPRDHEGKLLIQRIFNLATNDERFRYRIIFIENYDMCVGRYLVQGVDVWLNNPLAPREASGTSGMKAAANGVLNLSIYDGWWAEGQQYGGGWTIGRGEIYEDKEYQNQIEANAIYDILEKEVVPAFYERGRDGIPNRWVQEMKLAMRNLAPLFNTKRMVAEYAENFYLSAHTRWHKLHADGAKAGKALAHWKGRLQKHWSQVRVETIEDDSASGLEIGAGLTVKAHVHLGQLQPNDVSVQLYYGQLDGNGMLKDGAVTPMHPVSQVGEGVHLFEGMITSLRTGLHGYTIRILPNHEDLPHPYLPGLIYWKS